MGIVTIMLKRLGLAALIAGTAIAANAQEIAQVDSETNWSIYVASDPKECFIVSQPTEFFVVILWFRVSFRTIDCSTTTHQLPYVYRFRA